MLYIFDMDGVLLDSMPLWEHLGIDYLKRNGREPKTDFRDRVIKMSMPEAAELLRSEYGFTCSAPEIIKGLDSLAEEFYTTTAPMKSGADKALEKICAAGGRCVILTATDRPLAEIALERTGLKKFFCRIYTCTELRLYKSSPKVFEKVLELENTDPKDAVVVEDAWHAVQSASLAGIPVLAIYDASSKNHWEDIQRTAERALSDWSQF